MARVLIAEDEGELAETLAGVLRGAGHEVRTTGNGDEALVLAGELQPELVISDWMLGSWTDGIALIEGLRAGSPRLAAILMTGYPTARLRAWADPKRGLGFLEKPFSLSDFRALVQEVLEFTEPA